MDKSEYISNFMKAHAGDYSSEPEALSAAYFNWRKDRAAGGLTFNSVKLNFRGISREESLDGRDYLVAPCVMINEGVHSGSGGAVFYPGAELESSTASWNHKPVMLGHPTENGKPVSACSKDAMERTMLGFLLNTEYLADKKALRTEVWLDVAKANKVAPGLVDKVNNGEMLEVSTGLFTDDLEVKGKYNGEDYDIVAFGYRPDHHAILLDCEGACSIKDGAGFPRTNSKKGVDMDRKKMIENMIASGFFSENDQEMLEGMEEKSFQSLVKSNEVLVESRKAIETFKSDLAKANEKLAELEKAEKKEVEKKEPEKKEPEKKENASLEDFIKTAPDGEVKSTIMYAVNQMKAEIQSVKDRILGNKRNRGAGDPLFGRAEEVERDD